MIASLVDHVDRQKWNSKYATGDLPAFEAHPLVELAAAATFPDGPVLELAAGPSGSALALAAAGRQVTVVDVSDVGLALLEDEARRRGVLTHLQLVQDDLLTFSPRKRLFALVLCTMYWERSVFPMACGAVAAGGLLAWEAYSIEQQRFSPRFRAEWCLGPGEPASLLPHEFEVIEQTAVACTASATYRLLARRRLPR